VCPSFVGHSVIATANQHHTRPAMDYLPFSASDFCRNERVMSHWSMRLHKSAMNNAQQLVEGDLHRDHANFLDSRVCWVI
jgi:hypothetical protein